MRILKNFVWRRFFVSLSSFSYYSSHTKSASSPWSVAIYDPTNKKQTKHHAIRMIQYRNQITGDKEESHISFCILQHCFAYKPEILCFHLRYRHHVSSADVISLVYSIFSLFLPPPNSFCLLKIGFSFPRSSIFFYSYYVPFLKVADTWLYKPLFGCLAVDRSVGPS